MDLGFLSQKTMLGPGKEEAIGTGQVNMNIEEHHIRRKMSGSLIDSGCDLRYTQYMKELRNILLVYDFGEKHGGKRSYERSRCR
jgi:hypothetical protein